MHFIFISVVVSPTRPMMSRLVSYVLISPLCLISPQNTIERLLISPPSSTLKKNYGTHVIKLDIALKTYPLGQYLFISASNNMFYCHSQWDKSHTIFVVNLMLQDTKLIFLNRSFLGSNLQLSQWVSDTLPLCYMCLVQTFSNWMYLELNIFLACILPTPFPISTADKSLSSNPSLKKISAAHVIKLGFEDISTRAIQVL